MLLAVDALDDLLQLLDYPRRRTPPWVIGVIANLSGNPAEELPPLLERRFVEISAANFDRVLAAARPRVKMIAFVGDERERVELSFQRLADFDPASIVEQLDPDAFGEWRRETSERSADAQADGDGARARPASERLTAMCKGIVRAPEFQALEGTWRGVRYLVDTLDPREATIRVWNVRKYELDRNLRHYDGTRLDRSPLFRKVYDEAYDQFGAHPYSLLVGDMGFSNHPVDFMLLYHLLQISASAAVPLLTAAAPELFGKTEFQQVASLSALTQLMRQMHYAKWNSIREDETARFGALCVPRLMARPPYRAQRTRAQAFAIDEETTDGSEVWMNPAYVVASALVNGFAGRPIHGLPRRVGQGLSKAPVEATFDPALCAELAEIGLIALAPVEPTGERVHIHSVVTLASPRPTSAAPPHPGNRHTDFTATVRETRVAHKLHVMLRDSGGAARIERLAYRTWRGRVAEDAADATKLHFQLGVAGFRVSVHDLANDALEIQLCRADEGATRSGSTRVQLV